MDAPGDGLLTYTFFSLYTKKICIHFTLSQPVHILLFILLLLTFLYLPLYIIANILSFTFLGLYFVKKSLNMHMERSNVCSSLPDNTLSVTSLLVAHDSAQKE